MTVVVWSERVELNQIPGSTSLHDCAYSSALMCLVYGGKISYPLGEYTPEEREALERSDDRPDEQGATPDDLDVAIARRYKLAWHKPTEASLGEAWKVGRALSVGGNLSNFPTGHRLRQYAPTYTGGHRVCVIPTTATAGLWGDPLAPNKSAFVAVTLAEVGLFAKLRAVSDLRFTMQNEYATSGGGNVEMGFKFTVANPPAVGLVTFDKGDPAWSIAANQQITLGTGGVRDGYAAVSQQSAAHTPGYVVNLTSGGVTEAYFLRASDVTFAPSTPVATKLGPGLYEV